jgi:hypothetical protein
MKYIVCDWKHDDPGFPIRIYSELDEERYETRKIEIFPDGRVGYADLEKVDNGDTGLSEKPLPSIEEINADPVFDAKEISKEEFEQVWCKYVEMTLKKHTETGLE